MKFGVCLASVLCMSNKQNEILDELVTNIKMIEKERREKVNR